MVDPDLQKISPRPYGRGFLGLTTRSGFRFLNVSQVFSGSRKSPGRGWAVCSSVFYRREANVRHPFACDSVLWKNLAWCVTRTLQLKATVYQSRINALR